MASLNTLRTKGGVIVTIVIFLALIAFIAGDLFSGGRNPFNSDKMRVGEINGKKIDYVDFVNQSEYVSNIHKMMWGRDSSSAQEQEMVYNESWERLIMEHSYGPSFEDMGLMISMEEQNDMVYGNYLSPVITQTFANPNTRMFDRNILDNFLLNANDNDNAYAIWKYIKEQMDNNRLMTKYFTLVTKGFYITDSEVEKAVEKASNTYTASVVSVPLHTVADSLVNISESKMKQYYNSHKGLFKQDESRGIEYVVFDVLPSATDYAVAEKAMNEMAEELTASTSPMQYAALNSHEKPDTKYYKESELSSHLAELAFGKKSSVLYGPALSGDTYSVSRVADIKMLPDSIGARHILLEKTDKSLADSLVRVIKKRGSDFAKLAREFSIDPSAQTNGGDLGRFAPEQMVAEFSDAAIKAKTGSVYTVESQFGLHVVELTYKSAPQKKAQIATLVYKVDPSAATMQDIYNKASNFVAAAGSTTEGFKQAVVDQDLSKRTVRIKNTERSISGLKDSRELVRWAFTNKKGSVSAIMQVDDDYIIATLTEIKEEGYIPFNQAKDQIEKTLVNEEKGMILAARMTGSSLESIAEANNTEVVEATNIKFNLPYIPELGAEAKLIGAITGSSEGVISKPVMSGNSVYVFEVTNIQKDEAVTTDSEKARLEANTEFYISERIMQAMSDESDIVDMRVKFF